MGGDGRGRIVKLAAGAFVLLGDRQAQLRRTEGSGETYVTDACLVAAAIR